MLSKRTLSAERLRLIVPFPPGGSTDFTAGLLAQRFAAIFCEPVAAETLAGDDGLEALREMVGGAEDAAVLVGNINTNSLMPVVQSGRFDFDYLKEVLPISRLAEFPSVVMTEASSPATTLAEFLDHQRRTSGVIRYGTDFLGSYVDYDALMLGRVSGLGVAYHAVSGALGILGALKAGKIDLAMLNVATATRHRGEYRALAVTGARRLDQAPEIPTLAEAGYPGLGTANWQGLFASSRMPRQKALLLHAATVEAVASAEFRDALAAIGARAVASASPEEFAGEIEAEMRAWERERAAILAIPRADTKSGAGR